MSTKPLKGVPQELGAPGRLPTSRKKRSTTYEILWMIAVYVLLTVVPLLLAYAVIRLLFGPITIE